VGVSEWEVREGTELRHLLRWERKRGDPWELLTVSALARRCCSAIRCGREVGVWENCPRGKLSLVGKSYRKILVSGAYSLGLNTLPQDLKIERYRSTLEMKEQVSD